MDSSDSRPLPPSLRKPLAAYEWTYFITPDSRVINVSSNCEQITGYSAEEYMKNPDLFRSIIFTEDQGIWDDHIHHEHQERYCSHGMDLRILTKSGEEKWIKHSCQASYDGDVFLGNEVCNRDITVERQISEKLRYTEESLRRIIAATAGKEGKEFFNSMVLLLGEVTKADYSFIGQTISKNAVQTISLSNDGELLDNFVYSLKETPCDNVIGHDTCIYDSGITKSFPKDQLLIDMQIEAYVGTPVLNPQQECIGIIVSLYKQKIEDTAFVKSIFEVFAANIGREMEREKAQRSYFRNERELSAIYDNAPLMMLLLGRDGKILKMNKRALESSLLTSEEASDCRAGDVLKCMNSYEDRQGCSFAEACEFCVFRNFIVDAFEFNKSSAGQTVHLKVRDGAKERNLILVVSATYMCIEEDEVVLLCIEDVTEKSEAREKIFEQNQKYEALNKNLEEVNNQLRISMEKAASSIKAKDEFLSMMSHEMRTPLNPIMGYTSLMQMNLTEEPYSNYLKSIYESSSRMLSLVDNLLEFSGIQKSATRVLMTEIEFDPFIKELLSRSSAWSEPDQIVFYNGTSKSMSPYDSNLWVESDRDLIAKVLLHLLANACKFSSGTEVQLNIGIVREDELNLRLRFEVKDEGIGIAKDKLGVVFNPFMQVDSSYTRSYEGIGMGLAICMKIIGLLDGEIGVESVLHEGSTFWFEIPVKRVEKENLSKPKSKRFTKRWNILAAEDQVENQQYLSACVEHLGGDIKIVENGEEVLSALEKDSYDIILMDIRMPVMDGLEASRRIRSQSKYSTIPILALSAHNERSIQGEAYDIGVNGYMSKPVKMSDLSEIINSLLDPK